MELIRVKAKIEDLSIHKGNGELTPVGEQMLKELEYLVELASNTEIIGDVSGISFENEELHTIKTDVLHIYDKVSLNETEVHKRNMILNKIKKQLGDNYYR